MSQGKTHKMLLFSIAVAAAVLSGAARQALAEAPPLAHQPVFQVDVANPTADKPQSKLWFARGSWWAWLPHRQGSSIWRRNSDGWRRAEALDESLRNLPGRADVSSDGDTVRAVLVAGRRLAIVTLQYCEDANGYVLVGHPIQFEVAGGGKDDAIETATIARDSHGCCWIAYPWQRRMWVRATLNADQTKWTEPFAASAEVARDDLCAIVALPGAIGLAWSDQSHDTMNFRLHKDGADAGVWEPIEEIERGNRNADDHINAKATADGTLLLATKNSVDRVGAAQLVLRVRHPSGRWENLPYAVRTNTGEPSRPMILLSVDPPSLLLFHTLYGRADPSQNPARHNTIVWQEAPLEKLNAATLDVPSRPLIRPRNAINNVTGCKGPLPAGFPWSVLASDAEGNVYEGRVDAAKLCAPTAP